ncbi:hypothetical protein ACFFNY_04255 [Paenibacillus hodogayensis]|uniref:Extracellular solute-binding protein n=1 Tax=Paenibacillus hodogayensis TaxID=279208 RepID=A0ABV5VR79_9BACL
MNKKALTVSIAALMAVTIASGCTKQEETASPPSDGKQPAGAGTTAGKYDKPLTINISRPITEASTLKDDLEAKMLKEKFNLVFKAEDYPRNDWPIKSTLLFATGEGPEYLPMVRDQWKSLEWMASGYLRPFEKDELATKLSNYRKIWTDEEWDAIYKINQYSDGKLYYLPGKRTLKVNQAWQYRKDLFDKYGLKFPTTPDEMYTALKTIKDKTGLIPVVTNGNASSPLWGVNLFFQVFGLPDLALNWTSYVDPATKEFVAYPFADDRYRDFLIFLNKMYKEGLLLRDFATATADQTKKLIAQGNNVIAFTTSDPTYNNNLQKAAVPDVNWAWTDNYEFPSKDPKKVIYKREPLYSNWGPAIKKGTSQEKVDRILDYLNWSLSDEGQLWYTFGKEGVTYEMKNGSPVYLPNMSNPSKAEGDKLPNYGISIGWIGSGFVTTHKALDETYSKTKLDMADVIMKKPNYYGHIEPALQFTEAERQKLVDLETNLNAVRDEYWLKLIMGSLDPSNDGDWKKFMDAANKAGLQEVVKLRTEAYKKANKG